jgi:uncharacterized protein (TIGR02145 family)
VWSAAISYCDNLDLGGHTDWHLPNIDELISLIRGCQDGTATGDLSPSLCEMTPAGCAETDSCVGWGDACYWCSSGSGPASGCYWDPALGGACSAYWSSSSHANDSSYAWFVTFGLGYVDITGKYVAIPVRCVRGGVGS